MPTGRLTLLDFWTFCCINCMHVLPDLQFLEDKYPELLVIGIHSAKFDNERSVDAVRNAVIRYSIRHPVVLDSSFAVWRQYGIHAWPTMVLVDAGGSYLGSFVGEGHRDRLDGAIGQALLGRGASANGQSPVVLESDNAPHTPLLYPGKVAVDEGSSRICIADSGHHRIIVAGLDGESPIIVGEGAPGSQDGDFHHASFSNPQGVIFDTERKNILHVCDTDNHLLRTVDLNLGTVTTLAGTGGQNMHDNKPGPLRKVSLSSPWDLAMLNGDIFVAMAGTHQIWRIDLKKGAASPYAGNGREARADGSALAASFAQPSGIATDGSSILVADSEISSLREITSAHGVRVCTVAGGDLFEYGDRDASGDEVRLQHPLGIEFGSGKAYVADTYNHKIKQYDPVNNTVTAIAGTGKPGFIDGSLTEAQFNEPSGLAYANNRLFVADTNNHAIRIIDIRNGSVQTLSLPSLCAPDRCFPTALD